MITTTLCLITIRFCKLKWRRRSGLLRFYLFRGIFSLSLLGKAATNSYSAQESWVAASQQLELSEAALLHCPNCISTPTRVRCVCTFGANTWHESLYLGYAAPPKLCSKFARRRWLFAFTATFDTVSAIPTAKRTLLTRDLGESEKIEADQPHSLLFIITLRRQNLTSNFLIWACKVFSQRNQKLSFFQGILAIPYNK